MSPNEPGAPQETERSRANQTPCKQSRQVADTRWRQVFDGDFAPRNLATDEYADYMQNKPKKIIGSQRRLS